MVCRRRADVGQNIGEPRPQCITGRFFGFGVTEIHAPTTLFVAAAEPPLSEGVRLCAPQEAIHWIQRTRFSQMIDDNGIDMTFCVD